MAVKMTEQLSKRFHNIEENLLIAEASFLDPRFKGHGFADAKAFDKTKIAITQAASNITRCCHTDRHRK